VMGIAALHPSYGLEKAGEKKVVDSSVERV
jgi:hypothetical protein